MWLLKRNGPIIAGIYLSPSYGKTRYSPTFHIHSLWKESLPSVVYLDCCRPLLNENGSQMGISFSQHTSSFADIISAFKQQFPFAFNKDLLVSALIEILEYDMSTSQIWPLNAYVDAVLCLAWCRRTDEIDNKIAELKDALDLWPQDTLKGQMLKMWPDVEPQNFRKPSDCWENQVRALLTMDLQRLVEEQAVKLKLSELPDYGFTS